MSFSFGQHCDDTSILNKIIGFEFNEARSEVNLLENRNCQERIGRLLQIIYHQGQSKSVDSIAITQTINRQLAIDNVAQAFYVLHNQPLNTNPVATIDSAYITSKESLLFFISLNSVVHANSDFFN